MTSTNSATRAILLLSILTFLTPSINLEAQNRGLLYYVIVEDKAVSSDFLIPFIEKELESLTDPRDSAFFGPGEIINYNKLAETDLINDNFTNLILQNVGKAGTIEGSVDTEISQIFKNQLKSKDYLMTIKVNAFREYLEYQFYLYSIEDDLKEKFELGLFKKMLSKNRIGYENALVTADSYEDQIRFSLHKLFPKTNKPPKLIINQLQEPFETCIDTLCNFYAAKGDTLQFELTVIDEDSELKNIEFEWTIDDLVLKDYTEGSIRIAPIGSRTMREIKVKAFDGISYSDEHIAKVTLVEKPQPPSIFPNLAYYFDDHYQKYFRISIDKDASVGIAEHLQFALREVTDGSDIKVFTKDISQLEYQLFSNSKSRLGTMEIDNPKVQNIVHAQEIRDLASKQIIPKPSLFIYYLGDPNSDTVKWFQKPHFIPAGADYIFSITPVSKGIGFERQSRTLRMLNTPRFALTSEFYAVTIMSLPAAFSHKSHARWSPSIGLSYRILEYKTRFPMDLDVSFFFPTKLFISDPIENFRVAKVIPRISLNMDFLSLPKHNIRTIIGPTMMYLNNTYQGVSANKFLTGVFTELRGLMPGGGEMGLSLRYFWGGEFSDGKKNRSFQATIVMSAPFF